MGLRALWRAKKDAAKRRREAVLCTVYLVRAGDIGRCGVEPSISEEGAEQAKRGAELIRQQMGEGTIKVLCDGDYLRYLRTAEEIADVLGEEVTTFSRDQATDLLCGSFVQREYDGRYLPVGGLLPRYITQERPIAVVIVVAEPLIRSVFPERRFIDEGSIHRINVTCRFERFVRIDKTEDPINP